ncbi:SDR family NAD(P)-dependent oxidoreductase [Streptomyces sp. NPDC088116]|uniref:SDR family NAD(P)-dependent oxidoreductase n=1 Tax=Streptomyces sp. NPDC088116 TaxID=3365825 RepID=UPI00381C96AC
MKTVVITGCSAGVGRATALLLDRVGWQVFAIVRRQKDAYDLESAAIGPLKAVLADVTDREQLFAAAAAISKECGEHGLDGLICNAGAGGAGPLEFAPVDELTKPIDSSLYGSIFSAQAFLPLLRKAKGRIINVTSGSNLLNMPLASTYPAAKYALELISRQLQAEVRQFGVSVIVVDPGRVKSRMTMSAKEQNDQARAKLPPEAIELYGDMLGKLDRLVGSVVGSGKDPEIVAQAYLTALTDRKPKAFYNVGTDTKVLRVIGRWAPRWVLDTMTTRILERGGKDNTSDSATRR